MNQDARVLGTLNDHDGLGVVRVRDVYDSTPDDVWAALTDPERLERWLGHVEGDLRLGGLVHARYHASGWEGTMRVETCDPPRLLRLTSAPTGEGPDDGNEGGWVEVRLTPDGDRTALVVEEGGMPLEHLPGYGAGIQVHVEDLGAHLAGRDRCDSDARMSVLYPLYQQRPVDRA